MNTRALSALADVICRARKLDRTPMGIAFAIDTAGMHQSPETAAEHAALQETLAKRSGLLREVQKFARQRTAEAKGRKAYGDRLKAENAELRAALHEVRKEVRAIQSWVTENTPYSGRVPGQVLRTLTWLRETKDMNQGWLHDESVRGRERLRELIAVGRESDRLRLALKSAKRGRAKLRARVAELETERHSTNEALAELTVAHRAEEPLHAAPCRWPASPDCTCVEDVSPQVEKLRGILARQRAVEDPHDSPLHHDYALGHDLPEVTP